MTQRLKIALLIFALLITAASTSNAQVGQRNFYSALVTEGADPSNDLTLAPGWVTISSQTQFAFSGSIEKEITDTFSVMLGDAISDASRRRVQASTGADNLEILVKWAFYTNPDHEFRAAAALDVFAPTGDVTAGAGGHWRGGPMILAEKGAGDLPDRGLFHYLRPFGVQMDAEYLPRWTGSQSDIVAFDAALSYQLDYLAEEGFPLRVNSFFKPLVFFNEFDYQQVAFGTTGLTTPDWRLTPGIAYMTPLYQVAIGTQLGITDAGADATHSTGLFQVDIYYDQIFPKLGPIF
jgi:hypothetical protein